MSERTDEDVWTDPRREDVVEWPDRPGVEWTIQGAGPDPVWDGARLVRGVRIEGGAEIEGRMWSLREWKDVGPRLGRVVRRG